MVAAVVVGFVFSNSLAQTKPDQPPSAVHISGRVVDQSGTPLSGQVVNFRVVDTGSPDVVKTTQDGRFAFSGHGYTPYELYVPVKESFDFKHISTVVVVDGHDFDFGDVVLQFPAHGRPTVRIAGPVQITQSRSDGNTTAASPSLKNPTSIVALYISCSAISTDWCGHSVMHIITGEGREVLAPEQKDQVGCKSPMISDDGSDAGWLIDSDFCCTSYPISTALVVYRPGKPIRRFEGGMAIMGWHFVARGKQVAFYTDFLHGSSAPHYELRDVETGRLVAKPR